MIKWHVSLMWIHGSQNKRQYQCDMICVAMMLMWLILDVIYFVYAASQCCTVDMRLWMIAFMNTWIDEAIEVCIFMEIDL